MFVASVTDLDLYRTVVAGSHVMGDPSIILQLLLLHGFSDERELLRSGEHGGDGQEII